MSRNRIATSEKANLAPTQGCTLPRNWAPPYLLKKQAVDARLLFVLATRMLRLRFLFFAEKVATDRLKKATPQTKAQGHCAISAFQFWNDV